MHCLNFDTATLYAEYSLGSPELHNVWNVTIEKFSRLNPSSGCTGTACLVLNSTETLLLNSMSLQQSTSDLSALVTEFPPVDQSRRFLSAGYSVFVELDAEQACSDTLSLPGLS